MKTQLIIATLGLASVLSFGASAAVQQVNADQAQNLQRMGSVSVTSVTGSPMDIRHELAAKAEKAGASSYRVTELNQVTTGMQRQNCINKPSSYLIIRLAPGLMVRGFFHSMPRVKAQLPFKLFFRFIKQQYQCAKTSSQLIGQMDELNFQR